MNATSPTPAGWPIVGHDWAVALLTRAVAGAQPSHAYLFTGPEGVGKGALARIFTRALFCLRPEARPCDQCRACQLVAHENHPDFLLLDLEAQRRLLNERDLASVLKVETMRQLQNDLIRRPVESRWRVVLLPEAERLTTAAANAFLKTLEEPPAHVVLLLTARDKDLLLPTILSRCQLLPLRPVPTGQIAAFLQDRWGLSAEEAAIVARLSGGRIGWAVQAATVPAVLEARRTAVEALKTALPATRTGRLALAQTLAKTNDPTVLSIWASWWRDVLLLKYGAGDALMNIDLQPALEEIASRLAEPEIRRALHVLQRMQHLLQETNVNVQLAWEVLLLALPRF
ncbi:MAG: DNA polymerase III subunit delta' [Ardenticatenaceae bacterium]|nr:DNA polymerase III subunit delta' [Ardenticatenaceae bacterium]